MHSGYPIGATIKSLEEKYDAMLNVDLLRERGMYGPSHELGHNHQWRDWTIEKTMETGCNWWDDFINKVNAE